MEHMTSASVDGVVEAGDAAVGGAVPGAAAATLSGPAPTTTIGGAPPRDAATVGRMARMRQEYSDAGLDLSDVAPQWWEQFQRWFDDAVEAGVTEPNAMVLATSSVGGFVAARSVLAKSVDEGGVVFYTNYTSAKSHDLAENPHAAATFPWYDLHRQIHVRGSVAQVDRETTATYWRSRPRGSQLGAWASPQSAVLSDRAALDHLQRDVEDRFGGLDGDRPIPPPPHWGGWRITPLTVEFWQGRTNRLHDRLRYRRDGADWIVERLAP